jgi:cytochrome P450
MVVVSSYKTAVEMLDKKSAIYSDRPILPMGGELCGWNRTLVLTRGERHRLYRRLVHKLFGNQSYMKQFHPTEEQETHKFLRRVMNKPEDLQQHVRQ